MKITAEELKAAYRRMSKEELLALDRGELTDMARQCYDAELEDRGLNREAEPGAGAGSAAEPEEFGEPLVAIHDCGSADEAWGVQSALEAAGIPARIGDDRVRPRAGAATGLGRFRVAVPASYADQARAVLNAESTDTIIVTARYENGVFKPVEEIEIPEGTVVEVHVPSAAFGDREG